jgi:hypothetical protein
MAKVAITRLSSCTCAASSGGMGGRMGLVLGVEIVAEVPAGRIEHRAEVGRALLALDAQEHLAQAVHRAGGQPAGGGERRQGVERAKDEVERVDDVESLLRHGGVNLLAKAPSKGPFDPPRDVPLGEARPHDANATRARREVAAGVLGGTTSPSE